MPILEDHIEILEISHENNIVHSKDDHTNNEDEYYEYLILNSKYYKKDMLSNKGKVILQNKDLNA